MQREGKASVLVAEGDRCLGLIALADTLRPETGPMVSRLAAMGVRSVLMTGDNERTAGYFAQRAGITDVHAGLLPEDKVRGITRLQAGRHTVCMIGDGVNDAPALKTADIGVAMGSMGSAIAVDTADVALMDDDLSKIPYLKRLSVETVRTIKTSITLSMVINFAAVLLSLLSVLTPTTGRWCTTWAPAWWYSSRRASTTRPSHRLPGRPPDFCEPIKKAPSGAFYLYYLSLVRQRPRSQFRRNRRRCSTSGLA